MGGQVAVQATVAQKSPATAPATGFTMPRQEVPKAQPARRPQQAAAIPFRRKGDRLLFCLVTSSGSGAWTIPKGMIEPGQRPRDTALQEAHEEAGLVGRIIGRSIGCYEYAKWGTVLTVATYLMEVSQAARHWQERAFRRRRWVSAKRAARLLARHPSRDLFLLATQVLKTR